jgi:phage terminase small subunit
MGRPPKPTALKVLHGVRKDRINRNEPKPCADGPVVPTFQLSADAQGVWDRLAPDRIRQGVLDAWGADAFSLFCECLAIAQSKVGPAREKWDPKASTVSPLSELRTAVAMVTSLGAHFGWTPADRQKLDVAVDVPNPNAHLLS